MCTVRQCFVSDMKVEVKWEEVLSGDEREIEASGGESVVVTS